MIKSSYKVNRRTVHEADGNDMTKVVWWKADPTQRGGWTNIGEIVKDCSPEIRKYQKKGVQYENFKAAQYRFVPSFAPWQPVVAPTEHMVRETIKRQDVRLSRMAKGHGTGVVTSVDEPTNVVPFPETAQRTFDEIVAEAKAHHPTAPPPLNEMNVTELVAFIEQTDAAMKTMNQQLLSATALLKSKSPALVRLLGAQQFPTIAFNNPTT